MTGVPRPQAGRRSRRLRSAAPVTRRHRRWPSLRTRTRRYARHAGTCDTACHRRRCGRSALKASQAGRRLPCCGWPGVSGPGGIGPVSVCCRAASLPGPLSGHRGCGRWGRRRQIRSPHGDRVATGAPGTAVRRAGQVRRPRSARGRAGRGLRTRLSADPEPRGSDRPGQRRTSPGRWGSASLLTQTISMPCPENTVPASPDGVDRMSRAWPSTTLKTSGAGPPGSWIVTKS